MILITNKGNIIMRSNPKNGLKYSGKCGMLNRHFTGRGKNAKKQTEIHIDKRKRNEAFSSLKKTPRNLLNILFIAPIKFEHYFDFMGG